MPLLKIRAHYEHMPEFERVRDIGLKEAGWSNRLIARHLCRSDAAIRRCWQEEALTLTRYRNPVDSLGKCISQHPRPQSLLGDPQFCLP
ncbi:hypothetical protein LAZ67_1000568 [Cordylochernes scorpioides]|uniref:Transposase n=1 Tax=Cordylochernes scorpioides TaxID=51811 RepID=A0ABY6JZD4_9ARAC|nr:hypothetical protein LAZ67_1000568 [Cordylochernes scorpioides]